MRICTSCGKLLHENNTIVDDADQCITCILDEMSLETFDIPVDTMPMLFPPEVGKSSRETIDYQVWIIPERKRIVIDDTNCGTAPLPETVDGGFYFLFDKYQDAQAFADQKAAELGFNIKIELSQQASSDAKGGYQS